MSSAIFFDASLCILFVLYLKDRVFFIFFTSTDDASCRENQMIVQVNTDDELNVWHSSQVSDFELPALLGNYPLVKNTARKDRLTCLLIWACSRAISLFHHQSGAASNHVEGLPASHIGPSLSGPSSGSHAGASQPSPASHNGPSPWAVFGVIFMY